MVPDVEVEAAYWLAALVWYAVGFDLVDGSLYKLPRGFSRSSIAWSKRRRLMNR